MKIVFLSHPTFLGHQSMPRFVTMLSEGFARRGYDVEVLSPKAHFAKLTTLPFIKKWLGYIDQYIIFRSYLKERLKKYDQNTLFVIADHALGPWVPLVKDRPHVIHCHDFLAQRSALREFVENPTSWTGRKYQEYIRAGYSQADNFISVSFKTQRDLHQLLGHTPALSTVVYNALDEKLHPEDEGQSRSKLQEHTDVDVSKGYILHVGGNQWYKNRIGVVGIYNAWREVSTQSFPLILLGELPDEKLGKAIAASKFRGDVRFITGASDLVVRHAYSGASIFLFPSLAEGFGWPIAEAMACGAIVVTTDDAPMNEVGGEAAKYVTRMPSDHALQQRWFHTTAELLNKLVNLSPGERDDITRKGIENAKRFNLNEALNSIELVYKTISATKHPSLA